MGSSLLLWFRLNWKERGNGLVGMGGKENATFSYLLPFAFLEGQYSLLSLKLFRVANRVWYIPVRSIVSERVYSRASQTLCPKLEKPSNSSRNNFGKITNKKYLWH